MMLIVSERLVKTKLDGTFTRVNADGTPVLVKVKADFMPSHAPRHMPQAVQRQVGKKVLFTEAEDAEIVALTNAGRSQTHIAIVLSRKGCSIKYRQDWLRARGRL